MADEKVVIDLQVVDNTEASIKGLKELKKLLSTLPADSEAFGVVSNKINDIEDALKGAKKGTADLVDTLAAAPGPLGKLGQGLNALKVSTVSFGAALKAAGIGLLVSIIGGIAAAFNSVEGAGKKLEPLLIGFQKILGGILEVIQPLLDVFLELALQALPYVTKGIGALYSGFVAFFTLIKEAGLGTGKILKGIFTLDTDLIKEGWEGLKGSWGKTVIAYEAGVERFEKGTKRVTAAEKKSAEEIAKIRKEQYDRLNKDLQERTKIQEAEIKLAAALTAQRLENEKDEDARIRREFENATKIFVLRRDSLKDQIALAKKFNQDYRQLQADLLTLEAEYVTFTTESGQQIIDNQRKNRETELKDIEEFYKQKALVDKRNYDDEKNILDKRLVLKYYTEQGYNAKLRVLNEEFDQERLRAATEQQTKELTNAQRQKELKLINDREYGELRNSIILKANAVAHEVDNNRYNR